MEQVIVETLQASINRVEESLKETRAMVTEALKETRTTLTDMQKTQEETRLTVQKTELSQKQTDCAIGTLNLKLDSLATIVEPLKIRSAVEKDREEQRKFIKANLKYPGLFSGMALLLSLIALIMNIIWHQ